MSENEHNEHRVEVIDLQVRISYIKIATSQDGDRTKHEVEQGVNSYVHIKDGRVVVYTCKNGSQFAVFMYGMTYESTDWLRICFPFKEGYTKFDRKTNCEIVD